jgi:N-dimethylarginine dimethylaminohydrolase
MIDTRDELVNALSEAAELEHGLLVQYLFAAFSMKRRTGESITPIQQALLVDRESTILRVAHGEMYHLASVCNLLSADRWGATVRAAQLSATHNNPAGRGKTLLSIRFSVGKV